MAVHRGLRPSVAIRWEVTGPGRRAVPGPGRRSSSSPRPGNRPPCSRVGGLPATARRPGRGPGPGALAPGRAGDHPGLYASDRELPSPTRPSPLNKGASGDGQSHIPGRSPAHGKPHRARTPGRPTPRRDHDLPPGDRAGPVRPPGGRRRGRRGRARRPLGSRSRPPTRPRATGCSPTPSRSPRPARSRNSSSGSSSPPAKRPHHPTAPRQSAGSCPVRRADRPAVAAGISPPYRSRQAARHRSLLRIEP